MLGNEIKQRMAKEYRYAATKMQETTQAEKKAFYFSATFGEAQRSLNWEWNSDIAFVHLVTSHVYQQINSTIQMPGMVQTLPIDWKTVFEQLTLATSDLAAYFEKTKDNKEELYQILSRFAEIAYAVSGNGSYLYEKGIFKL